MTDFFWGCAGVALIIFSVLAGLALIVKMTSDKSQ